MTEAGACTTAKTRSGHKQGFLWRLLSSTLFHTLGLSKSQSSCSGVAEYQETSTVHATPPTFRTKWAPRVRPGKREPESDHRLQKLDPELDPFLPEVRTPSRRQRTSIIRKRFSDISVPCVIKQCTPRTQEGPDPQLNPSQALGWWIKTWNPGLSWNWCAASGSSDVAVWLLRPGLCMWLLVLYFLPISFNHSIFK